MYIENEVFKRSNVDFKKLEDYGFKKNKGSYIFEKNFLDNNFNAVVTVDDKGIVSGDVIDLQTNEKYLGLRVEMSGEFVNRVRELYKDILIDIRNNCFQTDCFINDQANRMVKYIKTKYNTEPEFLWDKFKDYGVFRNSENNKWFGIIMNIDLDKLGKATGKSEIINIKLDENKIQELLKQKGFYEAYHMNKKYWISVILNDTLSDNDIINLIDESYNLVK